MGFPGETDEDFEKTYQLCVEAGFDGQFAFVYSPRPKTVAGLKEAEWGPVPHEVKVKRLERLNALQKQLSVAAMSVHVGGTVEVLVEGASRTNPLKRMGRTSHNRVVNFEGDAPIGALVEVNVQASSQSSLMGAQGRVLSLPLTVIPEVAEQLEVCVA